MNRIRNQVTLIGNLGQDPEVFKFDNGKKKIKFSLATHEVYRNAEGEKVTSTQWHNIIAWGKISEIMGDLLKKGKQIAVMGRLNYRSYEDKEGKQRYVTEIVVEDFALMSPAEKTQADLV